MVLKTGHLDVQIDGYIDSLIIVDRYIMDVISICIHYMIIYNRRDMMDDALLRPGRLEVQIEIGLPKVKFL